VAFAFERDDANVEQGMRRIATEQIDKALMEASAPLADFDKTVHQLRRRCKNLRGLLRMVRPGFKAFKAEDGAIRTIAGQLAQIRDATVMVETFDRLVQGTEAAPEQQQLRNTLIERSASMLLQIDQAAMLRKFCEALSAMRHRAGAWTLQRKRFAALAEGIEDTYRALRRDMRAAAADDNPAVLHAWRKQAKYHRHHVMLLRRHAPDVLDGRSKLLAELAEMLGGHHDLAVLVEVLSGRVAGNSAVLEQVAVLASERQAKLATEAFALGGQLAVERPRDLTERLKRYWQLEAA
jgi:CHAD domain-containing protein